jgi:hypothetical protein
VCPGSEIDEERKSYHDAAAHVHDLFGAKLDAESIKAEEEALLKLYEALNGRFCGKFECQ